MQRTLRDVRELRLSAAPAEEPEVDLALVWPLAATRSWSAHKTACTVLCAVGWRGRRLWPWARNLSPALQAWAQPVQLASLEVVTQSSSSIGLPQYVSLIWGLATCTLPSPLA